MSRTATHVTISDIKQRRAQRISTAQREYVRLVGIAANNPLLAAEDADALGEILDLLGIDVDSFDADRAAVEKVTTAKASIVPSDEVTKLGQTANASHADLARLKEESEKRIADAAEAAGLATVARNRAVHGNQTAHAEIESVMNERPRAFGKWDVAHGSD